MKEKVVVSSPPGVEVRGAITAQYAEILTPAALAFLAKLSRAFEPRRRELLATRARRQAEWLAAHRARAFVEEGVDHLPTPFNILDVNQAQAAVKSVARSKL